MKHTLSFIYLDDCQPCDGYPLHIEFDCENDKEKEVKITKIIKEIFDNMNKSSPVFDKLLVDRPSYWDILMCQYEKEIIYDLCNKRYWVWNYYEKYYVIAYVFAFAFALDYETFEISSKDCYKRDIEW